MGWLRLDDDYASDGTLRRCKAVQWWPLILCAMKRGGGVASDDDIAPDVLADIGQGDESAAARAVERLKSAGKLVEVPGGWTTPGWSEFQPDPTASDRAKRYRERNKAMADAAASRCVTVTSRDETVRHGDVTVQNGSSRLTGQDMTGHDDGDSRAPARETPVPSRPAPNTAGADLAVEKLAGHSGHEVLLPIARVAVSVLGVCPEVYTLEQWAQARYSLARIEYGLRQAKQSAAGQFMPLGKIIISAGRWMQRAEPEEYQKRPQQAAGDTFQVQSISTPQEPVRRPLTAAETAEMLKELGV